MLARSGYPNYAHFGESYAWAPDRVGLHTTIRVHEKSDGGAYGRIQTVGYIFSPDAGRTWQRSDGTQVALPVTAETFDVIASGGIDYGGALEAGALAVAPDGTPWLVHSEWAAGVGTNVLCTPDGRRELAPHRPERARGACAGTLPRGSAERRVRRRGPAGRSDDHRRRCRRNSVGPSGQRGRTLRVRRRRRHLRHGAVEHDRSGPRPTGFPTWSGPRGSCRRQPPPASSTRKVLAGDSLTDILSNRVIWAP